MTDAISVLIIDDEATIRHSLAEFLEDYDYLVSTAPTGESALSLLQKKRFDVAIVDLRLPGINGEAFILRANDLAPHMCYLIHTGSVDYRIGDELSKLGIGNQHLFAKPLEDLYYFVDKIEEMVKDC